MEPIIHVQKVKDLRTKGVFVEREANVYTVSSPQRIEWLEALEAVTSYIEKRDYPGGTVG